MRRSFFAVPALAVMTLLPAEAGVLTGGAARSLSILDAVRFT
jgi:hypothetical protein